jgi:hypothetical protein
MPTFGQSLNGPLPLLSSTAQLPSAPVRICAKAFIGPGVLIGDRNPVGARSAIVGDLLPDLVCAATLARNQKARGEAVVTKSICFIAPAFNARHIVAAGLESVARQAPYELKHIIDDGGSNAGSPDVPEEIGSSPVRQPGGVLLRDSRTLAPSANKFRSGSSGVPNLATYPNRAHFTGLGATKPIRAKKNR